MQKDIVTKRTIKILLKGFAEVIFGFAYLSLRWHSEICIPNEDIGIDQIET